MAAILSRCTSRMRDTILPTRTKEAQVRRDSKPISLGAVFSAVFVVYILGLIAALEYCFRAFPVAENRRDIPKGSESDTYGPYRWAPLARVAGAAVSISPLLTSDAIPTPPKRVYVNSTTTAKLAATPATSSNTPGTTSVGWNDPVTLGNRTGIPRFSPNTTQNGTSNLARRVPPPDKYGQLPDFTQLVEFDAFYSTEYQAPFQRIIWAEISYFYDDNNGEYFKRMAKTLCPVMCDGPALVFLNAQCWSKWKHVASRYTSLLNTYPTAVGRQLEDSWLHGKPCSMLYGATKTYSLDAEIIRTTTVAGIPSRVTVTTRVPIEVEGRANPLEPIARPVAQPTGSTVEEVITTRVAVLSDDYGNPTATMTRIRQASAIPTAEPVDWVITTRVVLYNEQGRPTATVMALLRATRTTMTMTDSRGLPTATIVTDVLLEPTQATLRDSNGGNVVITTQVPIVPGLVTLTDSNGVPVATVTGNGMAPTPTPTGRLGQGAKDPLSPDFDAPGFHPISWRDYVLASFGLTLMTLPLTILAQMQSSELKALLPFYALTRRPQGATAADSLCLVTGGWYGFLNTLRLLFVFGEPVAFLADLLILSSSLVVSFSSEALGIKLYGHCQEDDFKGCHMGVAVFNASGRCMQAFLALTLAVVLITSGLLMFHSGWRKAVDSYVGCGRSIAASAALLSCTDTREYLQKATTDLSYGRLTRSNNIVHCLEGHSFSIQPSSPKSDSQLSHDHYLAIKPLGESPNEKVLVKTTTRSTTRRKCFQLSPARKDLISPLAFLSAITGFLIIILYYELTTSDSAFERFMDSQGLGVRFLFTSLGIIVSLFWDNYFLELATKDPYRQLAAICPPSSHLLHAALPTTPFSALTPSNLVNLGRRGHHLVLVTATIAALSKVIPLLLSNVPFSPWLTWPTHQACAWSAVGILALMILVLAYGMGCVRYPVLPVHPGTLAGRLFYVCDSRILEDLVVGEMETTKQWVGLGKMVGVSGEERIGMDYTDCLEGIEIGTGSGVRGV
ncbi:hypothetical protein B0H63DRAFT_559289 [Podospora didyma]|uniref:Uncharacterized protein n=1 Tax=Podospora didyma TaxID=330526 RepID=A0AAE0NUC5_9PEZI|nr:hypothetical protein B0H63DRAFT_559289 [Podospora didyma]